MVNRLLEFGDPGVLPPRLVLADLLLHFNEGLELVNCCPELGCSPVTPSAQ